MFNKLSKKIHDNNLKNGWGEASFLEMMCLIHTEISEAVEDYRNNKNILDFDYIEDKNGYSKPMGIPSELADIIIRVLDTCGKFDIDIDKAINEKIEYNTKRGYKHGNKKI